MVLTIATIVAFQVYWLQRNYREENRLLTIRTNLLFRETVLNEQVVRLDLDTTRVGAIGGGREKRVLHKLIRYKFPHDSVAAAGQALAFVIRDDPAEESKDFGFAGGSIPGQSVRLKIVGSLEALDSLRKPVPVEEISALFRRQLDREKLDIPFRVSSYPGDTSGKENMIFPDTAGMDNKVTVGFRKRLVYQLDLDHLPWFILRKIAPQILFSLVLVTVTVLSFLLLYRNWQRQKRLTRLKNDFISNITHELKTPIATMSVAVEALRNFNALDDPRRTREYLDISAGELQRLSLLVDKVLKLSLFEKQEIELKKEPFNLKELVDDVAASMRLQFEKYQAKLHIEQEGPETGGRDFSLRADKLHITSVVYNLLDNALKYSKSQPLVQVGLRSETESLVLSVADNGIGIPSAYREKIFEKFFRVPAGDRHNVKGYGLGLSYVAYVLQRQGGEISVESEPGVGSRFTVKIPRDHA